MEPGIQQGNLHCGADVSLIGDCRSHGIDIIKMTNGDVLHKLPKSSHVSPLYKPTAGLIQEA